MTNKFLAILLALALVLGCALAEPEHQAVLYADFSYGEPDPQPEAIQQFELGFSGELTAELLVEGLSALTGLDFFVTIEPMEGGLLVDWAADSTLIANLDDREQSEHFFFYDSDAMRWFMLDSLWRTLRENIGADVYYRMNGGEDLVLPDMEPVSAIPADIPYMGSAFYFNNDGRGDYFGDEMALNTDLVLVGALPKDAELIDDYADDEGNYRQLLLTSDGAITIATIRQVVGAEYPMEMALEDFLAQYLELGSDMPALEPVEAEPVAAYPTERARFIYGENEDTTLVDFTLIRTDSFFFGLMAYTSLDIYEGMIDGYEPGDVPETIDIWVSSLDLFDGA